MISVELIVGLSLSNEINWSVQLFLCTVVISYKLLGSLNGLAVCLTLAHKSLIKFTSAGNRNINCDHHLSESDYPSICKNNCFFLQDAGYECPERENLCPVVCNAICLTTSYFLAAKLQHKTVIESVTVAALTGSVSFTVLLSNTTRFLPSPITWRSCTHQKGRTLLLC